jgi:hypothetical protein
MSTVRYGVICDLCEAGSRNYAHDANFCEPCGRDLCDTCAAKTGHRIQREADDEGRPKEWTCEDTGGARP